MDHLDTDRCKKQEAKGEVCPVCFGGSLTVCPDGRGVLQPTLTIFFLSELFLLFHPAFVIVLSG